MKQDKAMTLPGSAWYFSKVAEEYASRYHAQSPGGYGLRVRQQRVLELLDQPGGKVLDVGCGPGILARELLDLGYEFWGVDAAPGMIEQCRNLLGKTDRAHLIVGDAATLAFPKGFFDAVICTGVLDHVIARESAIKEMIRVTRKNGTLLISFPNLLSPYAAWRLFVYYPIVALLRPAYFGLTGRSQPPTLYRRPGRPRLSSLHSSLARIHTVRTSAELMARHGVEITDVAYFNYNLFLSPLDELLPRWTLEAIKRLERLRFGKLKWLGVGFILQAKKRS